MMLSLVDAIAGQHIGREEEGASMTADFAQILRKRPTPLQRISTTWGPLASVLCPLVDAADPSC